MAFLITSLGTIIVAALAWLAVQHRLRERRVGSDGSRAIEVAVFLGVFGVVVPVVFYLGLPQRLAGLLEYLGRPRVEPPEARIAASPTGTVEERHGQSRYVVRLNPNEKRPAVRSPSRRQPLAAWQEEPAGFRGGREELVHQRVALQRGQRSDVLQYQPPPWRPGEKEGFRRRWELRTKSRSPFHSYVNQEGTPTRAVARSGQGRNPPEQLEIEVLLSDAAEDSPVEVEFTYYREPSGVAAAAATLPEPGAAPARPDDPAVPKTETVEPVAESVPPVDVEPKDVVKRHQSFALEFDGKDDTVEIAYRDSLRFDRGYTIACWLYLNRITSDDPEQHEGIILDKWKDKAEDIYWAVRGGLVGLYTFPRSVWSRTRLPLQTWVHVACTRDLRTARIYVNGVREVEVVVDQPIYVADAPIRLGALVRDGQRRLPLDGRLDELALYSRALGEREIQDLMKRRPDGKAVGLVAYYDFDDGAGQTLTDKSGSGNHGRLGSSGDEDSDDPSWVAGKELSP